MDSFASIDYSLALEAGPKLLTYIAVLLAIGACGAHWLSTSAARAGERTDGAMASAAPAQDRRLASWLTSAATLGALALAARGWGHTAVAMGVADASTAESLSLVLLQSDWGAAWRMQMGLMLILVVAGVSAGRLPRVGWWGATAVALACAVSLTWTGHAAGEPGRVALHGAHMVGAGLWLGTLTAIRLRQPDARRRERLLAGFASLALPAAFVVVVSGGAASWLYLAGDLSALWSTAYGRALLVKLAGVAGVLACGLLNWRRYRTKPSGDSEVPAGSMVVTSELVLGAFVVAVTAILTELPHGEP